MKEKDKMLKHRWYDANNDEELIELRIKAEDLCFEYNQTKPSDIESKNTILNQLFPTIGNNVTILSPIYTDYGIYTTIGNDTFINHNAYLMDGGTITIGNHCFIGPNCGMYTANHPLIFLERNQGYEIALPIIIEDDVWIGANVTILPGITIGKGSVIGAGSVVTKNIPSNVVALGNPCKVIRPITKEDTIFKGGNENE